MLAYRVLESGELKTNCYLVWDEETKKVAIIDPADDGVGISEEIERMKLKPVVVLLTHGHFDHVLGAVDLKLIYQIPIAASSKDKFLLNRVAQTGEYFLGHAITAPNIQKIDIDLDKKGKIKIGDEDLKVIKTPGHTPGGISFYNKKQKWLFSGDTLFAGLRGRTDLSYSSTKQIFESIGRLMKLPEDTLVLPGHGEETTIGKEAKKYKIA